MKTAKVKSARGGGLTFGALIRHNSDADTYEVVLKVVCNDARGFNPPQGGCTKSPKTHGYGVGTALETIAVSGPAEATLTAERKLNELVATQTDWFQKFDDLCLDLEKKHKRAVAAEAAITTGQTT